MTNLEAIAAATLLATLEPDRLSAAENARFAGAMDALSATAFESYRDLVYGTEGFRTFFRQMTPIAEIAGLKIGSRPASRKQSDAIEDLRAIPWVFSWAQARVMLPGWYGSGRRSIRSRQGAAVATWRRLAAVRLRAGDWSGVAKSDIAIAARLPGWSRTRRCATISSGGSTMAGTARATRCGGHAAGRLLESIPRWTRRSVRCPISSRSTCCRSS